MNETSEIFWVGCFLFNPETKMVLLHHRDGNTENYPNKWAFFGGSSEKGETMEQCLARELKEEIGLEVQQEDMHYLRDYFNTEMRRHRYVFYIESDVAKEELTLGEGAGFDWIPLERLNDYDLSDRTKEDLEFFVQNVLN